MTKLIDIDAIFDNVVINEADVIEATRRSKISETSRFKMATDIEYQTARRNGALKTADIKRKIPTEDYESIIREYWDPSVKRKHGFIDVIAARYSLTQGYGSKLTGQIGKVIMNSYNTLPDAEYAALRTSWGKANPDFRTEMLKDLNKSGQRQVSRGRAHSEKCSGISEQLAREIYNICLSGPNTRSHDFYKQLAKQYDLNWHAVQKIALGDHYSLTDVNVERDIEQWRLNIGEGNYEMIDPDGRSHIFNDLKQFGYFLNQRWDKNTTDETRNWYTGRAWFEKCTANTWYTKERRTFKGWKYCNHLPAKYK
jgi:hypothetical protein